MTTESMNPGMRFITKTFVKGLVVVLPIIAAVYVLIWLVRISEGGIKGLLLFVIPEKYYIHGMGFLLMVIIIFSVGLLMYPWLTRKLLNGTDLLLRKIPIFGIIYSPARDLMDVLGGDMKQELGQVVLVQVPNTNLKAVGFVTRDKLDNLPKGFPKEGHVVVFMPWSYQIGGFCFIVPREAVLPIDITVEQGMRWSLTAGISITGNAAFAIPEKERIEKS